MGRKKCFTPKISSIKVLIFIDIPKEKYIVIIEIRFSLKLKNNLLKNPQKMKILDSLKELLSKIVKLFFKQNLKY